MKVTTLEDVRDSLLYLRYEVDVRKTFACGGKGAAADVRRYRMI